ncbi:RNA polymerase sigma-70 factor [Niabella sp.]|uniref:RNA polymerase sigma-70 factor n=1 Tax=Niabella sp. TaxID=1962976 RepID=UPI002635AB04|nr:RNA polymerase sigma-70 factor [Niabella sp.]
MNTFNIENELLLRISHGDQDAFKAVYDRFHEQVYTFSLWYLKSETEAEEVVQEVFLKLWQLGAGCANIEHLAAFLRTLTRNRSLDILRSRARKHRADTALAANRQVTHNDTEEQVLLNDAKKILEEAINLLPEQQKRVYRLCGQQGLKNDEVAKQLNLSPLTVRTHMKLALRSLRAHLVKHTDAVMILLLLKLF